MSLRGVQLQLPSSRNLLFLFHCRFLTPVQFSSVLSLFIASSRVTMHYLKHPR